MLVKHVKEPIVKGSTKCICKNHYQNSAFQSAENLSFENFSPGPTMIVPIVDSGCERMLSTISVNSAKKISNKAVL